MASFGSKSVVGAMVAGSLMFSSTAAVASTSASPAQVNPWAVLTAMSGGAPAAAMCGAAAAAAAAGQAPAGCVLPALDAPPPPPVAEAAPPPPEPVLAAAPGAGISPLLIGLLALAAAAGIYLAVHNSGHSNSPA
jgi:hypothetical protein